MSNSITRHVDTLIQQRAAYQAKHPAPTPVTSSTDHTVSLFGGLIKYTVPVPQAPQAPAPVVDTSALATRSKVDELNSVIAGQSNEIAQLRQAVLVLAKSAKAVETGIEAVGADMQVVKKQTAPVIRAWSVISKDLDRAWNEILEETTFIQEDCVATTAFRVLRQPFGAFTGVNETIRQQKREVMAYIKTVSAARNRIEMNYEYAQIHYPNEVAEYIKTLIPLTVGTCLKDVPGLKKKHKVESWTILDVLKPGFTQVLRDKMYNIRGV